MKLASIAHEKGQGVGLVHDRGITDVSARLGIPTMIDALRALDRIREAAGAETDFAVGDVRFLPVVQNPARIICVGLNYRTHLEETGREMPTHPIIFTRFASSQVGHGEPILRPLASGQLDFEGELALVIGQDCRRVSRDDAFSVIAGYSNYNDGSVRDWQRHTMQWGPGKNFPQTGGFGPYLVTADEIGDIRDASLVTRLNGAEMQRATIADLLFGIPELIEYCSAFTPLEVGDVIVTGTTGGVGMARTPPLWMKAGDVVEVEIDGLGILSNPVADER